MINDITEKKPNQENPLYHSFPIDPKSYVLNLAVNGYPPCNITGGGCYKQKGRNTYRVWFPWKGKKVFINKYFDGTPLYHEDQAKRVLEGIRREVEQGIFDPLAWGRERVLQFEKAWEVYQKQCSCGLDRMEARERIFRDFLLPYFKGSSLRDIEEHHILEWWTTIPKSYAPGYLKVIRATLRAFLTFHKITRMKMIKFPTVKVPKKTPEWLSKSEQDERLKFIPFHHVPIFKFLMAYGCRVSEACNLKKSDIDLDKNIITFRERKNNEDNTLPISDEIKPYLKGGKITHWELVFCTANGERYTRQILYKIWIDGCKKANVKTIPLKNATRHSLACQLLESGESTAMVSRILGNSETVIQRFYGAISVQSAGKALERISKKDVHQMCTGTGNE